MKVGKVDINIKNVWNGNQLELEKKTGINKNTLTSMFRNRQKRVDLNILAKICFATKSTPGDILKYTPPDGLALFEDVCDLIKYLGDSVPDDIVKSVLKYKFGYSDEEAHILLQAFQ